MNRSLDEVVQISTPENVTFQFRLGGLGSRFIALLVDMLVQIVMFTALVVILAIVGAGLSAAAEAVTRGYSNATDIIMSVIISLIVLGFFLIQWGYFVFFEVRQGGQTPGKRLMHLRVVRDEGQPVRFFDSVIRNVLRIADMLPATYMTGVISILVSSQNKRIGDLAAGTIVVREGTAPAPALATGESSLASDEAALIGEYLARRVQMSPEGRLETAKALASLAGVEQDGDEEAITTRLRELVAGVWPV